MSSDTTDGRPLTAEANGDDEDFAALDATQLAREAIALARDAVENNRENGVIYQQIEALEAVLKGRARADDDPPGDDQEDDDDDQAEDPADDDQEQEQERAKAGAKAQRLRSVLDDWHETPAHPRTAERLARPPLPLYRATMTLQGPANEVCETDHVSLEIIVTHEYAEGTRDLVEMPEWRQAGWQGHGINGFRVHIRVIGD